MFDLPYGPYRVTVFQTYVVYLQISTHISNIIFKKKCSAIQLSVMRFYCNVVTIATSNVQGHMHWKFDAAKRKSWHIFIKDIKVSQTVFSSSLCPTLSHVNQSYRMITWYNTNTYYYIKHTTQTYYSTRASKKVIAVTWHDR